MFQAAAADTKISASTPIMSASPLVNTSGKAASAAAITRTPADRQEMIAAITPPGAGPSPAALPPAALPLTVLRSLGPGRLPPEQASRADREHEHERGVEHQDGPVRRPDVDHRLQGNHQHAGGERAADAAEPAEDDDGQQPRDQVVPAVGVEAA